MNAAKVQEPLFSPDIYRQQRFSLKFQWVI